MGHVNDPLFSVPESGAYIGTGDRFVRRLIAERRIRFTKIGTHVRIRKSDLDAFIAAGVVEPRDPRPSRRPSFVAASRGSR